MPDLVPHIFGWFSNRCLCWNKLEVATRWHTSYENDQRSLDDDWLRYMTMNLPHEPAAIRADMNLEDLLSRFPASVQVFVTRRMYCFGCPIARFETIAEACAIYREPLPAMLSDLSRAVHDARRCESGARP